MVEADNERKHHNQRSWFADGMQVGDKIIYYACTRKMDPEEALWVACKMVSESKVNPFGLQPHIYYNTDVFSPLKTRLWPDPACKESLRGFDLKVQTVKSDPLVCEAAEARPRHRTCPGRVQDVSEHVSIGGRGEPCIGRRRRAADAAARRGGLADMSRTRP